MGFFGEVYKGGKGLYNYIAAGGTATEVQNAEAIVKMRKAEIADAVRAAPGNVRMALAMEAHFGQRKEIESWSGLAASLSDICHRAAERIAPPGELLASEGDAFGTVQTHIDNFSAWIARMDPNLRDFMDNLVIRRRDKNMMEIIPTEINLQLTDISELNNMRMPTRAPGL
jgi:hypothetical protein